MFVSTAVTDVQQVLDVVIHGSCLVRVGHLDGPLVQNGSVFPTASTWVEIEVGVA